MLLKTFLYSFLYLPYLGIRYLRTVDWNTLMRVRSEMLRMFHYSLRYHGSEYRLPGLNEEQDRLIRVTVAKLCSLKRREEDEAFEAANRETIDKEAERIEAIPAIRKDLALFQGVLASAFSLVGAHDDRKKCEQRAKSLDEGLPRLSRVVLFLTEARAVREQAVLRRKVAIRSSPKINISAGDLGPILTVLSSFFLVSGFLYNNFLLGAFDIEVPLFFSLSDYLAASIEAIRYSAFAALMALLGMLFAMDKLSQTPPNQSEKEAHRSRIETALAFLTLGALTAIASLHDSPNFYRFLALFLTFLGFYYTSDIAERYFKNTLVATAVIAFLVAFTMYMGGSIGATVHEIKNSAAKQNVRLHLVGGVPADIASGVLIAANSNYYFFYDREKRRAYALPKNQVRYVEIVH